MVPLVPLGRVHVGANVRSTIRKCRCEDTPHWVAVESIDSMLQDVLAEELWTTTCVVLHVHLPVTFGVVFKKVILEDKFGKSLPSSRSGVLVVGEAG